MHYKKAFPSKYLKAHDLSEPTTYTIRSAGIEEMQDGKEKLVVRLDNCTQRFVVNMTNANRIGEAYGDDTDQWVGKRITLCSEKVQFGADLVDGIRVRIPAAGTRPGRAQAADHFADLDDEIPFAWVSALIVPWGLALLGMGGAA
jgi:hypothetical protein